MSDTSQDKAQDVLIAQADALMAAAETEREFLQAINIKVAAVCMRVNTIIAEVNASTEAPK